MLKAEGRAAAGARSTAAAEATWIVADYLDVVLHVFTPEAREYYELEDLWGDVPSVELEPSRPSSEGLTPRGSDPTGRGARRFCGNSPLRGQSLRAAERRYT